MPAMQSRRRPCTGGCAPLRSAARNLNLSMQAGGTHLCTHLCAHLCRWAHGRLHPAAPALVPQPYSCSPRTATLQPQPQSEPLHSPLTSRSRRSSPLPPLAWDAARGRGGRAAHEARHGARAAPRRGGRGRRHPGHPARRGWVRGAPAGARDRDRAGGRGRLPDQRGRVAHARADGAAAPPCAPWRAAARPLQQHPRARSVSRGAAPLCALHAPWLWAAPAGGGRPREVQLRDRGQGAACSCSARARSPPSSSL